MITYKNPQYLWWLMGLLPFIIATWIWIWSKNKRSQEKFIPIKQRILESPTKLSQVTWLALCDVFLGLLIVLALVEPAHETTVMEPIYESTSTMILIDNSPSMKAESGYYGEGGRLGAVKKAFYELLNTDASGSSTRTLLEGHKVGIVAFAGEAFCVVCPPTVRRGTLTSALKHLSTDYTVPGTNFAGALEESLPLFKKEDKVRAIIMLTDGEEEEGHTFPIDALLEKAKKEHVKIFSIVVGHETALIPGTKIWTTPGMTIPKKMADATGGSTFKFDERDKLYGKLREIFAQIDKASEVPVKKSENLQWLCAIAFLLIFAIRMLIDHLMPGKKYKPNPA